MDSKEKVASNAKVKIPLLGIYLLLMSMTLTYLIFELWPETTATDGKQIWQKTVSILQFRFLISSDSRLMLLVIFTGALGSCVHAATSFSTFVGNRSLMPSWMWWYILRPFIGMALALIFYFVVRGGLLSTGAGADDISPFGIAAVAGLVGMFSKQATDKLRELFDNLFKTEKGKGDDLRKDKLGEMLPVSKVMVELNNIKGYRIPPNENEEKVRVSQLKNLLEGYVTRIPILDNKNIARYVIHQSLLYKFIALKSIDAATSKTKFDLNKATLQDFLEFEDMRELTASLAFVSIKALLREAKQEMEKITNCQDVFVTESGNQNEPINGWLTNVDIAKNIES